MCGERSSAAACASRTSRSRASASLGVARGQELERDATAQAVVLGQVHLAHAAAAEAFDDVVVEDWSSRQGLRRVATFQL